MIAATVDRVERNTSQAVNEQIRQRTDRSIARFAVAGPGAINRRLRQLDREWDIERYLETMAPTFTLLGLALGVAKNRKWLILPAVVQSFFLQHAIQGWCPPMPVLRRFGIRTCREIQEERDALHQILSQSNRRNHKPKRKHAL